MKKVQLKHQLKPVGLDHHLVHFFLTGICPSGRGLKTSNTPSTTNQVLGPIALTWLGPAIQIQPPWDDFQLFPTGKFKQNENSNTLWLILLFLIGSLWLKVKLRLHRHLQSPFLGHVRVFHSSLVFFFLFDLLFHATMFQ